MIIMPYKDKEKRKEYNKKYLKEYRKKNKEKIKKDNKEFELKTNTLKIDCMANEIDSSRYSIASSLSCIVTPILFICFFKK